jgi:hypothetical protein
MWYWVIQPQADRRHNSIKEVSVRPWIKTCSSANVARRTGDIMAENKTNDLGRFHFAHLLCASDPASSPEIRR